MRTSVDFHRLAAREYRLARDWYAIRSPAVAERFKAAIDRAVSRIESEHESLPILSGRYRWVRVRGFPYILVCRARSSTMISVVAVVHGRRRPGYWRRRE